MCSFGVGTYDDHNPLEAINWLFYFYDIDDIREDIRTLFLPCCAEQKELKLKPDQLINVLYELYCYGWLLLQTDFYPEKWLTPDCYCYFYYPIIQQDPANWSSSYLSYEESMDLQETLSIEYASSTVRSQVSVFYSLVINHLTKGHLVCNHEDYRAVKEQMLRVLDILFLINLDLCKKRVKEENRVYPKVNDRK